jgi:hypothetical protein
VNPSVPPPGYVAPPDASEAAAPAPGVPARSRGPIPRKLIAGGLALACIAIAAFLLLGDQAVDPIAQAATVSSSSPGYRMNLSVVVTDSQLVAPISATGTAVVDSPDDAASMSLAMQVPQSAQSLGTSTLQLGMVLEGRVLYMKFPRALVNQLPSLGGKPWVEEDLTKAAGLAGLSSLGDDPSTSDPTDVLGELKAGAGSVTDEGRQVIDGVPTTHYHGELSVDQLVANVPSAARAVLQQITQGQGIPIDVWIDAHNLVRRVVSTLTLGIPNGPSIQETATADLSDYGPQPRPTPPPANQVTSLSSVAGLLS